MSSVVNYLRTEPARTVAIVLALIGVGTSFGLGITSGQTDAVVAAVGAVLALIGGETVRAQVTPTAKLNTVVDPTFGVADQIAVLSEQLVGLEAKVAPPARVVDPAPDPASASTVAPDPAPVPMPVPPPAPTPDLGTVVADLTRFAASPSAPKYVADGIAVLTGALAAAPVADQPPTP